MDSDFIRRAQKYNTKIAVFAPCVDPGPDASSGQAVRATRRGPYEEGPCESLAGGGRRYLASGATLGSPMSLLYSDVSDGAQYISRMSKPRGCSRSGNLFSASHGSVYIFGSSMVTVSSMLSWSTR